MPISAEARKKLRQGLYVGLAGALLTLSLWLFIGLDTWEYKTWDWRVQLLARPGKATDNIRIILLDQESLDWAREVNGLSWPWPRELYAALIRYCKRAGAKALAFDVLFTEPSAYGVADDEALGSAIADFGAFAAGSVFLGEHTGSRSHWPKEPAAPDFIVQGLEDWLAKAPYQKMVLPRATLPIAEVSRNANVLCDVQLSPDKDGIYRRAELFHRFDGHNLPIVGLGAFLAADRGADAQIASGQLHIADHLIPIDSSGRSILRFRGPSGTHRMISAASVIQSEIRILQGEAPTITDSSLFKDKYVFFGFSAPGLLDLRPTPVSGVYPGVEIHATILDNLLTNDFIAPVPLSLTIFLIIVLALSSGLFITFFSSLFKSLLAIIFALGLPTILALIAYEVGYWMPLAVLLTAAASTMTTGLIANYATEGRQKRFIKNAFKQYLSPDVIDQLIQHPERLKLGGERRVLSIFFSDLQGFTTISEGLSPEELTALLNEYLTAMTDIIHEEGGTVDKYEGDAIIAFWNAPLGLPDHGCRAVNAALRCQAKLAEMRPAIKARIGKELLMRIGLNTGVAIVGNMGSNTRFDYTMLGDAVNLAARLEGVNKEFGTYTIISETTRKELAEEFVVRELGRVAVVGRKAPVTIYEPMWPADAKAREAILIRFATGLKHYYAGDIPAAADSFAAIANQDAPASHYLTRCRSLPEPLPADWQGIWVMTTK